LGKSWYLPRTHPINPTLDRKQDNQYAAWFNTRGTNEIRRDSVSGGRLEGVLDLVEEFGKRSGDDLS
jgi:hypothetical protein